jgi:hypothetical protein
MIKDTRQTTIVDNIVKHLKAKKEQVEYLLEKYPAARDNDFYLQYMWLKTFGDLTIRLPFIEWCDIEKVGGQLESVRRVRQKIQNEDLKFLPSPEVLAKRRSRGVNFRSAIKKV